jgi:hypothetical protein
MRHLTVLVLLIASLLCVRQASAQDAGSIGVTMGYPASVGLLWHVTERVALRPELTFNHSSTETDTTLPIGGINTSASNNYVVVGLSALFYVAKWDSTRAYVVPRYGFSRSTTSTEGVVVTQLNFESTVTTHSGGVSFGAQHLLGEHFAIYGELGLSYDRLSTELPTAEGHGHAFGTRSGVGVTVYF